MAALGFSTIFLVALALIGTLVWLAVKRRKPGTLTLRDVGALIDRTFWTYRRNLVPSLLLATLCLPLGSTSGYFGFNTLLLMFLPFTSSMNSGFDLTLATITVSSLLGVVGLGKTLLACGLAQLLLRREQGATGGIADALPRGRWGAVFGLAVLLLIPSLAANFLGILGLLLTVLWAAAPAALIFDGLGPIDAFRRSITVTWRHYSALLNVLVPLWLIGWLAVGTPLFGAGWLLWMLGSLPDELIAPLMFGAWLIGSIFVAPLSSLGALVFYRFVREHDTPPPFIPTPGIMI